MNGDEFMQQVSADHERFQLGRIASERETAIALLREIVAGTSFGGDRNCHSGICEPIRCGWCGKYERAETFLASIGLCAR